MNEQDIRTSMAELIGTFMLVFIGAGVASLGAGPLGATALVGVVSVALAHGLILTAIVATFGHISGAHVNPAVTLGLLVGGKINFNRAGYYWIAQIIGALLAAVVLRVVLPGEPYSTTLGQTAPATGVSFGMIVVLEAILTFFLVSTVYQAAVFGKGGNVAPLLIGFTMAAAIMFGGPLTGGSLNPARTIGPAFLAKDAQNFTEEVLAYLIGTLLGGVIAGFLHSDYFAPADEAPVANKKRRK